MAKDLKILQITQNVLLVLPTMLTGVQISACTAEIWPPL